MLHTKFFEFQVLWPFDGLTVTIKRVAGVANAQLELQWFVSKPFIDHVGIEHASE